MGLSGAPLLSKAHRAKEEQRIVTGTEKAESQGRPQPEGGVAMTSSAQRRLTRLKRDMVLELFLQRGRFWDAVCDVRFRWGITPATQLPPEEGPGAYPPPGYPADALSQNRAAMYEVDAKLGRWREDLRTVHDRVVPKEGQITANRARSAKQWERFLSACMLFDPPETELVEFGLCEGRGGETLCLLRRDGPSSS